MSLPTVKVRQLEQRKVFSLRLEREQLPKAFSEPRHEKGKVKMGDRFPKHEIMGQIVSNFSIFPLRGNEKAPPEQQHTFLHHMRKADGEKKAV